MRKARQEKHAPARRREPRLETSTPAAVQRIQIEKPVYGGAFLGRVEGKAVFVPLTLPGETALVRITEDKRTYSTAEVDEIATAAPERIAPGCRHFGACGGCQYQHAGYATQVALKKAILRETLKRGGIRAPEEITVLAASNDSQAWAYRNRIRVALDSQGNPGYRGHRSNAIVPIVECPIAAPLLVQAAKALAEVAREYAPSFQITEVSLFCDQKETALLASVFVSKARKDRFEEFARAFAERVPELKGAELVAVQDRAQAPRTVTQWGDTSLTYYAAGFGYRVEHGAFFQINRWLVDGLVERVTVHQHGKLAWDLFAGVGLFTRKLTESFDRVVAVESAPPAVRSLKANLRLTCGEAVGATALDFLRGVERSERPGLIVVDPPRAGLGTEVAARLVEIGASALTYVSCDPATLTRDLRILVGGGYTIEHLTLTDLFPQTFHLETVAQLRRP